MSQTIVLMTKCISLIRGQSDVLVFSANWILPSTLEIGDGSATSKRMRALCSPGILGADPGGPRGCHPINGAVNVALHLHTSK